MSLEKTEKHHFIAEDVQKQMTKHILKQFEHKMQNTRANKLRTWLKHPANKYNGVFHTPQETATSGAGWSKR